MRCIHSEGDFQDGFAPNQFMHIALLSVISCFSDCRFYRNQKTFPKSPSNPPLKAYIYIEAFFREYAKEGRPMGRYHACREM